MTFFIAEPLSVFLFGKAYAGSGSVLAILSFAYYFHAAMGFNSLTLRVFGSVRSIVGIDFATASFSLVLTALLVPFYGAVGAALAMGGTLVIQNVLYQWVLARVTGISGVPVRYRRAYSSGTPDRAGPADYRTCSRCAAHPRARPGCNRVSPGLLAQSRLVGHSKDLSGNPAGAVRYGSC